MANNPVPAGSFQSVPGSGNLTPYPYQQGTIGNTIAGGMGNGTGFWTTTGGGGGVGSATWYQYPTGVTLAQQLDPYVPYVTIDTRIEFSEEEIMRAEQIMEECDAARTS